jgi:hypothetical protein
MRRVHGVQGQQPIPVRHRRYRQVRQCPRLAAARCTDPDQLGGQFDDIVAAARCRCSSIPEHRGGPCRAVAVEVKKAAHNLAGKALVLEVDTDELGDLAQRYQVQSIPNFALFSGGRLVRQRAGAIDHRQLERWAVAPQ